MDTILLAVIIVCLTMQTIVKRVYNDRIQIEGKYFFSTMIAFSAMMFFVLGGKDFLFCTEIMPYSVLFAFFYGLTTVCTFVAIASGPLSITALVVSYSLLIPAFYGLVFLHEPADMGLYTGIVFLAASLYLIGAKNENVKITAKWLINVILAFFGNGMCSVIQKIQQSNFDGVYKNEFMIIALLIVTIFLAAIAWVKERDKIKDCFKNGIACGTACGVMNGIVNLLIMTLSNRMSVSLLFPTVSAGDIVLTYIISKLFFKEKLSKKQFGGFCFGIVAVILLNI